MAEALGEEIGFIGLGVMGEPMCRHLAEKSGRSVRAYDVAADPLRRLRAIGVLPARDRAALAERAATIFLALPGGAELEVVCRGADGLLARARPGQTIVDLGTSPVRLTRALAAEFAAKGTRYADAPIARTQQAAEAGTLSVMVGADAETFAAIRPLLACFAAEITHCGPVGAGQVVKILNNMVLFQTVVALSEALAVARSAGVDGDMLFSTLTKGSADSFALRNHGMRAVLPGQFPERAFSAEYALKDLGYALDLAREAGLNLAGADVADALLKEAIARGYGKQYWPVLSRIVELQQRLAVLGISHGGIAQGCSAPDDGGRVPGLGQRRPLRTALAAPGRRAGGDGTDHRCAWIDPGGTRLRHPQPPARTGEPVPRGGCARHRSARRGPGTTCGFPISVPPADRQAANSW